MNNCSQIKDNTMKLSVGEDDVLETWKKYFGIICNVNTEEQVTGKTYGFEKARSRDNKRERE